MFKKLVISVVSIFLLLVVVRYALTIVFPLEYSNSVEEYSQKYGIKKELIYATIKAESNFDESAKSNKGAKGLMQITDETAEWCADKMELSGFDVEMLSNADVNIQIGTWYLKYLIDNLKSYDLAILSYNAGINKVKGWIADGVISENEIEPDNIPYRETKVYLSKVKIYTEIYRILYKK